jgi:hypothetical protein
MESDFKEPGTDDRVTSVAVMEGGMQANMQSIQKGEFKIIALSIADKTDDEPPEFKAPTFDEDKECDYDCKVGSSEKTKVNGMNSFKSIIECSGDGSSMKGKSHHFATNDKWIMLIYAVSPSSEFDEDVSKYDSAVNTMTVSNSIDFDFQIPEDMKGVPESSDTIPAVSTEELSSTVPAWVKSNAAWWSAGEIDDDAFIQGIQFLIKEGTISLPEDTASDSQNNDTEGIPSWIKGTAEWWSQDLITDDEFVRAIQYLIGNGIITVS